jgi:hypothetical protein
MRDPSRPWTCQQVIDASIFEKIDACIGKKSEGKEAQGEGIAIKNSERRRRNSRED